MIGCILLRLQRQVCVEICDILSLILFRVGRPISCLTARSACATASASSGMQLRFGRFAGPLREVVEAAALCAGLQVHHSCTSHPHLQTPRQFIVAAGGIRAPG